MNRGVAFLILISSLLIFSGHPSLARVQKQNLIKVAILDSGFCPDQLSVPASMTIKENWFATESKFVFNCDQNEGSSQRFHGQKVLEAFVESWGLENKSKIEITPIIMLDKEGFQTKESWLRALKKIRNDKFTLVVSSIGFAIENVSEINGEKWSLPEQTTYFFAAGEKVGRLAKVNLYPQILTKNRDKKSLPKIHLVGVNHQKHIFYAKYVTDWLQSDDPGMSASFATPRLAALWLIENIVISEPKIRARKLN